MLTEAEIDARNVKAIASDTFGYYTETDVSNGSLTTIDMFWYPDGDWTNEEKQSINRTKFGDGFEQRTTIGLNSSPMNFSLNFTRDLKTVNAMRLFLKKKQGTKSFIWKNPLAETARYVCVEWSVSREDPAVLKLVAKFEQVFES